jgi:alkyldihydroxyacetonephosphate synthase
VVVWPAAPPEVARVLKLCQDRRVAVGTVGYGARARRHWPVADRMMRVALDTRRMTNILDIDETALIVSCQCGIQVHHLEEALNRQGLSLGPFPVETRVSTLGGILSAPSPTAHSPRVGWIDEACLALSAALPDGSLVHTRVAPRKATGPDIARLFIGSRGGLGVITTATLRVHRLPEKRVTLAFELPTTGKGIEAARACLARGIRPARLRVLGQGQVREELEGGPSSTPAAALLVVLEGPDARVEEERRQIGVLLSDREARALPPSVAERWWTRCLAWKDPLPARPVCAGARCGYSRFQTVLDALPGAVRKLPLRVWAEQFTLQGGTLWLGCGDSSQAGRALRTLLLDAGLDPIRFDFPPLMDELRRQIDPEGIMVVMEGEWSGT